MSGVKYCPKHCPLPHKYWYYFSLYNTNIYLTKILVCCIIVPTGGVTLYESTSHYDPETKQSRPVRKYLGREDPVTGELIPSSGKRGRNKNSSRITDGINNTSEENTISILRARYEKELSDRDAVIKEQASIIKELKAQKATIIQKLSFLLQDLSN